MGVTYTTRSISTSRKRLTASITLNSPQSGATLADYRDIYLYPPRYGFQQPWKP
jgi:hypothetical protein